jgi:hypothetical protein
MLLVLEKAPGISVLEAMQHEAGAAEHVRRAATWLTVLHDLPVEAKQDRFDSAAAETRASELLECVDDPRIERTASDAIRILAAEPLSLVPSHGDYHPMNIYVAPHRVTAIDLDTLAARDPEADIGYFLAQTANFGLMMFDRIDATQDLRQSFVSCFPGMDNRRVSAHIAWTLLQSLHYDACILKIHNQKADLMVQAAQAAMRTGSLDLADA